MAKAGIWGFYTQGKERVGELPPPPPINALEPQGDKTGKSKSHGPVTR